MRKRTGVTVTALVVGALGVLAIASYATAEGGKKDLKADELVGYQENPDISTIAAGSFDVTIDDAARTLTYELSYSGLEGSVQQAHIHFGKRAINGGITVFLCGTAPNFTGPPGTPTCPQSGTVSRTVGAGDILAPGTQGIEAGNFEELAAALRAGHAYANVHSTKWPGGEIRAQINDANQRDD
jgi:CHRD domain